MHHVIVGTGPAGVIAAEGLRAAQPSASVTLIGDEPGAPYSRMAIPYLLAGNIGEDGTRLRPEAGHYDALGIELRQGKVSAVRPAAGALDLEGGESLAYDRLLIATGSRAWKPPLPGLDLPGVETCWTLADARAIAARAEAGARVVLMGAGFIGCIVLEALARRGVELTVVEVEDRMLPRMMDPVGGDMIKRWCERHGVTVMTSTAVEGLEPAGAGLELALSDGARRAADLVVCATGVAPNTELLAGSGVEIDQGVLVDEHLESSVPGIYAAGDVAQGPDFSTGARQVHAIQPTAAEHGRIAALNMAGQASAYRGSLLMNVLNTLGLISSSFGLWQGVEGGESAQVADGQGFKYLRLAFDGDLLVGGLALGLTQHVGVIRGLIQSRVRLGAWKDELMKDPHRVMAAYLERVQAPA
jgi:NAD(P)H-nitrite reductase large subunit